MAAKKKVKTVAKNGILRVSQTLHKNPSADVLRDMNHLAENTKSGQEKRTKSELQYDLKVRENETEIEKIKSNERIEFEKLRTLRIKYYIGGAAMSAGIVVGVFGKNVWLQLSRDFFKIFSG